MRTLLLTLLALAPSRLVGQVVVTGDQLGSQSAIARQAVRQFNDPTTTRVFGAFRVEDGEVFTGDLAITNGTLTVEGEVRGDIVAINADVTLGPGARVDGDILILGGSLNRSDDARLDGNTRMHRARVAVHRVGDELVLEDVAQRPRRVSRSRRWRSDGGLSIVLATGDTYNRVEGLPIHLGPRVSWGYRNDNTFVIEALAIGRTAGNFENNRQDIGYRARAALTLGDRSRVEIGARVYDAVESIEDWQLPADEIGWASFLWHRDYRDYFLSRGVEGYVEISPDPSLTLRGSVSSNEESSLSARDPWTPFRNNEAWRANPGIDEGTFTSVRGELVFDSRRNRSTGGSAWYLEARFEQASSDDVTPRFLGTSIRSPIPTAGTYTYRRLFIDLRRYERLGDGQLRFRTVGAGTIGNDPLPIQRRLSLGGPDPMPGFRFRQFNCNGGLVLPEIPALCDRLFLAQIEYRGDLSFTTDRRPSRSRSGSSSRSPDYTDFDDWFWFDGPEFVFFADVGTAWLQADGPGDLEADVGIGLEFGGLGVYAAKDVTNGGSARLTIRLHRRF